MTLVRLRQLHQDAAGHSVLKASAFTIACFDALPALLDVAEAAARFESDLSEYCDGPDRTALREALQRLDGGQARISDAASGGSESGKA